MWAEDVDDILLDEGLCTIEAEFLTPELHIRASITSPEQRLSDHLNSSTSMVELQPTHVQRLSGGQVIEVAGHPAYLSKAHLLVVIPIDEPIDAAPPATSLRKGTISQTCWAALPGYSVVGRLHMEAGRNPRLFLRSLEQRQFVPLTDARVTHPDGTVREYPTVVINRHQVHLLVFDGPDD
jgi:hypothetical protein